MSLIIWFEHFIFTIVCMLIGNIWYNEGLRGVADSVIKVLKKGIPGLEKIIHDFVSGEVKRFIKQVQNVEEKGNAAKIEIPKQGRSKDDLLQEMQEIKSKEINPEEGKVFAYVYTMEGDTFELQRKAFDLFTEKTGLDAEHEGIVRQFHHAFLHENALNPMIFPALRRFENEVVSMAASMMNGDDQVVGSLTSGGTESILMAMKAYRDRAAKLFPHIKHPEMVAPITIHPAHEKASKYFGFKIVHVPVQMDFRPDISEYEEAITPNTIALLCSAPQYCHGVVDPIPELSELAVRRGLPLHVDSCFGGFMLPWVEKLGYSVPTFDFRNPGVTSITADMHKYGFSAKGASVVLYRNEEFRKFQIFSYSQWPGGLFGSPSMAGTRGGGNIAAAWVTLQHIGQDGYLKVAKELMDTTQKLKEGIDKIPGLCILGKPHMTAFAIGSKDKDIDILQLADIMEEKGWKPERQQMPNSLHCTIMPHHIKIADELLQTLAEAAKELKENKTPRKKGAAAMYGMMANIPDKSIIDDFIIEYFSEVYKA